MDEGEVVALETRARALLKTSRAFA